MLQTVKAFFRSSSELKIPCMAKWPNGQTSTHTYTAVNNGLNFFSSLPLVLQMSTVKRNRRVLYHGSDLTWMIIKENSMVIAVKEEYFMYI